MELLLDFLVIFFIFYLIILLNPLPKYQDKNQVCQNPCLRGSL